MSTLRFIRSLASLIVVGVLFAAACRHAHAEVIIVERESSLRAEPALGASLVGTVAKGVRGESIGKSGIWVHVKTPEASGWVFTFNIRFGERGASPGDRTSAGRAAAARPKTSVVSTIGIRGLSEEELQNAAFSAAGMHRLDGYTASPEASVRRAQQAGLGAVTVDYLEEP